MEKLKIINPNKMVDTLKSITFESNLGEIEIDYADAWEIAFMLIDATLGLNQKTEGMLKEINDKYELDRY